MAVADELAGLRRGLGRDGQPIPAYQALGLAFRTTAAGARGGPAAPGRRI